jgi:cation diffusion facilitator family transporter
MNEILDVRQATEHSHNFLGAGHEKHERRTWAVIALCTLMMAVEIVGGGIFGSLAVVADGLHMSTHASAMLIAALAYRYARKHAHDRRFVFGTGKLGDLAGFTSAVILAMIALLIGYEALSRFMAPVPIRFAEAIPIAVVGLLVNVFSAWLLSGGEHHDGHGHGHGHAHAQAHGHAQEHAHAHGHSRRHDDGDGFERASQPSHRIFPFVERGAEHHLAPNAHRHEIDARDHNYRATYVHVMADAAVSVLAIIGLSLARAFGWMWMDPLAGIVGALVIANWSYGLIRDTGAILLDVSSSDAIDSHIRGAVETAGDRLIDLHVWRVGPGHFAAIASVVSTRPERGPAFYHQVLSGFKGLSHVTVEVHTQAPAT